MKSEPAPHDALADWGDHRVVVTGASGFIGTNLVRALVDCGAEIHAFVRRPDAFDSLSGAIAVHPWDMSDQSCSRRLISSLRPEVVFHAATHRDDPQAGSREFLSNNVLGAHGLLSACAECQVRKVVVLGSSLEYGRRAMPLSEEMPPAPETMHGLSKATVTMLARFYASAGLDATVLRLFYVYGGPFEAPRRFIPTILRAAMTGGTIHLTPRGLVHDFVHVEDVVRACLSAALIPGISGEVINVGTGIATDNHDVVALVGEIAGKSLCISEKPFARETSYACSQADIAKIISMLGWRPKVVLIDGLRREFSRLRGSCAATRR